MFSSWCQQQDRDATIRLRIVRVRSTLPFGASDETVVCASRSRAASSVTVEHSLPSGRSSTGT